MTRQATWLSVPTIGDAHRMPLLLLELRDRGASGALVMLVLVSGPSAGAAGTPSGPLTRLNNASERPDPSVTRQATWLSVPTIGDHHHMPLLLLELRGCGASGALVMLVLVSGTSAGAAGTPSDPLTRLNNASERPHPSVTRQATWLSVPLSLIHI